MLLSCLNREKEIVIVISIVINDGEQRGPDISCYVLLNCKCLAGGAAGGKPVDFSEGGGAGNNDLVVGSMGRRKWQAVKVG
jgi:hypothetical protein